LSSHTFLLSPVFSSGFLNSSYFSTCINCELKPFEKTKTLPTGFLSKQKPRKGRLVIKQIYNVLSFATMIWHAKICPLLAGLPARTLVCLWQAPGVLHHIMILGRERRKIFINNTDFQWKEKMLLRMRTGIV
jgi:hypothetical protein